MKILVTGAAGFIGYHTTNYLLEEGHQVIGVDNFNNYYEPSLKHFRNNLLNGFPDYEINTVDISNKNGVDSIFREFEFDAVIHLAAQAGVRLPVENYNQYTQSNLVGFENIASNVKKFNVPIFFYASSSSVYGDYAASPLSESELVLKPNSYYGATKYSNEIVANALFDGTKQKVLGLRFFSVYGPLGRPDMAYFRLIRAAILNDNFNLFGDGSIKRDFTYIDDVTRSLSSLLRRTREANKGFSEVINIGGGQPMSMIQLIETITLLTGNKININYLEGNKDDSKSTCASTSKIVEWIGIKPEIKLNEGITRTYEWMRSNKVFPMLKDWV